MRTIEEICAVIDEIARLTKRYELMQYTEEIRNAHKAEQELIIKELQSKELGNLIKKNRRDGFGELELDQGMPEYHYREGLSEGILIAIEIVKRGK